jgi:D-alanyl-D-alanine carboxypeptidase (penicillin-binding protein 5/6)
MHKHSLRRMAALGMLALVLQIAVPAAADQHRWSPAEEIEDGDHLVRSQQTWLPAGTAWIPWEGLAEKPDRVDVMAVVKPTAPTKQDAVGILSPSAVLMEAGSGRILYQKNAHERRNPASVTKIMTLIVAFDALRDGKVSKTDKVTISEEAAKQIGTIIFADAGETFTFDDLLLSVAVGSANDAAVAVAEHVSGSVEAFGQAMNTKARALGMHDTEFKNPTGLSAEGHFTSAFDIALMGRYAANQYPELIGLTSIYGADLKVPWRKNGPTFRLWNNNKLLTWFRGADGFKTGWTEAAGYCLAATAVRDNVRMISVVMGSETWKLRNAESAKLLEYGFSNYSAVQVAPKGAKLGAVSVSRGKSPTVDAVPRMMFTVSVAKGEQNKVQKRVELQRRIEAPVQAGQVVGQIVATIDGKEIGRMDLVAGAAVPEANLWETILYHVEQVFTLK